MKTIKLLKYISRQSQHQNKQKGSRPGGVTQKVRGTHEEKGLEQESTIDSQKKKRSFELHGARAHKSPRKEEQAHIYEPETPTKDPTHT